MKSVLFIVSTLVRAGPTQQLLNLCKHLPEFGWRPQVLTLSHDPRENLAHDFARLGVPVTTLGLSRLQGLLHGGRHASNAVQKIRPHVIHTSGIRSDALGQRISGAIPHVMTIRNFAWDDYPEKFGRIRGTVMAIQHGRLIRKAQMPVACSHAISRRLAPVRAHMRAIPNGVDIETFSRPALAERLELRKSLGLDSGHIVFLSVGALIPLKQPLSLLESFDGASFDRPATLLFLGDGPLRNAVESEARRRGNVRVLGKVGNVMDYYRCADFLASTSNSEGLPNSVLEAMACGLPVVLSDIEAHLEFQVDQHQAGATAALDDIADFSRKLEAVTGADWSAMSENARNLAMQFSARVTAERYAQLYSELGG